jgi:TonB family protein
VKVAPPSNGSGNSGGIGTGRDGGVGSGTGGGFGPGHEAGAGGGYYTAGAGISQPIPVYSPDPEYSDEARKAKFQGTVILWVVIGTDGRVHQVKVARPLGLGLDEKAIEAVKQWRFKPAEKDGHPVQVAADIEVNFRLY